MSLIWKVIVNPKAGRGRGLEEWTKIQKSLRMAGLEFSTSFTEHKYHAIELAQEAIKAGFRRFIAVGGDGTLHEVVCGIFRQTDIPTTDFLIAAIPVGTGNDWGRLYGFPSEYAAAAEVIAAGKTKLQDVAKVETLEKGEPSTRYMINIGGMAFDAGVCFHFDQMKMKGGSGTSLYVKGILKGFLGYTSRHFKIVADDKPFYDGMVFSTAFGIGKYSGGGMIQTPDAEPDDGLLEVTVIKKMSKLKLLRHIGKLFDGSILSVEGVLHTRAATVDVDSFPPSRVEVDGEAAGSSPVHISVLPLAINIIVP